MRSALDIVYTADHNYMFCCCVSIYSLMENMPPDREVRLHLLTDQSFCEEDARLIGFLSDRFSRMKIIVTPVSEKEFEKRDFSGSLWSKAVCYRLLLPALLADVDLCLYIDSDTLIVGDLTQLWETDMTGYCLAGVFDDIAPVREQTVGNSVPGISRYINSGVLLMNLKLMREKRIQERLLQGVSDFLVVDQDLLNVVCYDSIRLLPPEYNCIPGVRAKEPKILHFLMRDYLRPWKNRRAYGSADWWRCAEAFRDIYDLDRLRESADWYQRGSILSVFRRCADFDRIYVAGSGEEAGRIYRALRLGKCRGLMGILGEENQAEIPDGTLLVVASQKKEIPLLDHFTAEGGSEDQLFFFTRRPVSYYNLVPEDCRKEVYGELLMREFGVDARGVSTIPALLEMNAARYSHREALIFWNGSSRRSVSWRDLNRMANRMADWIKKQKVPRGALAALPDTSLTEPEGAAAMMGIIKAGCAVCFERGAHKDNSADMDILRADFSAFQDEQLSWKAPGAEALPEEPAIAVKGNRILNRQICGEAESLRRRIGWHKGDCLVICWGNTQSLQDAEIRLRRMLKEMTAAFAYGKPIVIISGTMAGKIWEISKAEGGTILSVEDDTLCGQLLEDLERRGGDKAGENAGSFSDTLAVRMLLTEASVYLDQKRESDVQKLQLPRSLSKEREMIVKWQKILPHIPVDGQGYENEFCYDSEWYV